MISLILLSIISFISYIFGIYDIFIKTYIKIEIGSIKYHFTKIQANSYIYDSSI